VRIDSHQHFTREFPPSLLEPILKRNRFQGTVAVTKIHSVEETRWLLALASGHDFIRAVVGWADLNLPGVSAVLDEYQRHPKFRGLIWQGNAAPGMAELACRGFSLDLISGDAIAISQQNPGLRVAVVHDGVAPIPELPADGVLKLSGFITGRAMQWKAADFQPAVRAALHAFGPERIMFGSDWPSYLPEGTWKEALAAFTQSIGAQSVETREHLLGASARRFYRIQDCEE
jgi:L-fuconolactonase